MSASIIAPNSMGAIIATNKGAFGMSSMPIAAAMAPARINGRRRPKRPQVRSEAAPTQGCTMRPMMGATNQYSESECKSAPRSDKIRLTLAFCSANPNCTPKNPKLTFQICQNDKLGC